MEDIRPRRSLMRGYLTVLYALAVLLPVPLYAESQAYDIPPVDGITIDGEAEDWGDRGFRVDLLPDTEGRFLPADDFDVRFRLGWDPGGLFVLVHVSDDIAHEHEELKRLWQEDCVEIFISEEPGSRNMLQIVLASGADEKYDSLRVKLYDHRPGESERPGVETVQAGSITADGYIIEVFIPWRSLGIEGTPGRTVGFQLVANDSDMEPGPTFRAAWFPAVGAHEDPRLMYPIRLAGSPSPPVTLHASRKLVMEGCVVTITGAAEEAGSHYKITTERKVFTGDLEASEGRSGAVILSEEMTKHGSSPYMQVEVSGRNIASFEDIISMKYLLDRYVQALGGMEAMEKPGSRRCLCRSATEPVSHARLESMDPAAAGETRFEITVDREGRWLYKSLSSDPPVKRGFDGSQGWVQDADGVRREDLSGWAVTVWWIDPRGALRPERYFDDLEVVEPEKDEGDGVYVIRGRLPSGRELRFVFDSGTGLLNKAGRLYFTDYRAVDGVLIPHLVYFDSQGNRTRFIIDEVRDDVPIDDDIFRMPDAEREFPDIFSGITDQRVLPMLKDLPTEYGGMNIPAPDGRFLYDLIIEKEYRRGLEIGTSNGYSTLWMGLAFRRTGGKIITVEYEKLRGLEAKENFEKAGLDDIIDLRINDAFKEIPLIEGEFDFIFLDAWKPDYVKFLEMIRDRVAPGGAIAAHNVVSQERSMRDFLEAIENDPGLETTFIETSSEGISLSIVKK